MTDKNTPSPVTGNPVIESTFTWALIYQAISDNPTMQADSIRTVQMLQGVLSAESIVKCKAEANKVIRNHNHREDTDYAQHI